MKSKTLKHPAVNEEWRDKFRNQSMRIGFMVSLSKSMLEFLCASADGVNWDRSLYRSIHFPDHWITAARSLEKRGLIRWWEEGDPPRPTEKEYGEGYFNETTCIVLTPAGEKVVELLKLAGMFVTADAAITKKFRKKKA